MTQGTLVGGRIRERRVSLGMKQSELAKAVNISASYLNLIEHNRRRIGGKLLIEIARVLDVPPIILSEGAGAALIMQLNEAASSLPAAKPELDRTDEFAGRFPGWAQLLAESREKIASLESTVNTLSDRLTHDPHLATSLHEVLTSVAAIRSTASILAGPEDVEPEWRARFHRNIFEDSARLAETSRALVNYLDNAGERASVVGTPDEEFDAILHEMEFHCEPLENGYSVSEVLARHAADISPSALWLLEKWLDLYAKDVSLLPMQDLLSAVQTKGVNPVELAEEFSRPVDLIIRRLAAMPAGALPKPVGLISCDPSGVLTFRKPLQGFTTPKFGAACPLWPIYRALARPMVVHQETVVQAGEDQKPMSCVAVTGSSLVSGPNKEPVYHAYMLIMSSEITTPQWAEIGVTCRVCPNNECNQRREPSILSQSA